MQEDVIVQGLQSHDEYYLELALQLYGKLVSFIIKKMLGTMNDDIVEELSSDTFMVIWRKADQIDLQKGSLKNLLCLIARNLTLNYIKKHENSKEVLFDFDTNEQDDIKLTRALSDPVSPDTILISAESVSEIVKCIEKLKEPYNKIFLLRYLYELDIEEIASHLHMKREQVDNYLSRGRKKLESLRNS